MQMLSRRLFRTSYLLLCLAAVAPLAVADDPTIDRLLASHCAQCHGTNGYATGGFDSLAGQDAQDLYDDLIDMKGEDRPEDIMDHQALGYSDDQIRRIANFYATLPEDMPAGRSGREDEEGEQGEDTEDTEDTEDNENNEDNEADD